MLGKSDIQSSVVLFGGINLDRLGHAAAPMEPDTSTPGVFHSRLGGVATNVAMVLSNLGVSVSLCGIVGEDDDGQKVMHMLESAGLDISFVIRGEKFPTPEYVALHQPNGDLESAMADSRLTEELTAKQIDWQSPLIDKSPVWFVDANLNEQLIEDIALMAGERILVGNTVSIAKSVRMANALEHFDILFTNRSEASAVLKVNFPCSESASKALVDAGIGTAIVSDAKFPIAMAKRISENKIDFMVQSAIPSKIVDVTGAGDVLNAVAIYGLLCNWTNRKTLEMASAAASICLGTIGISLKALNLKKIEQKCFQSFKNS